ncbi:MAG: UbiA family prenyltransferase, partial [Saprospiraceae bacterium]|nr:UbiA family prenyltransferase [Saprospiraceae bacterium]
SINRHLRYDNGMTPFFRLIRLPNLLIVALTQYLLQYIILVPELSRLGQPPVLPRFEFFLLVFSTVLIAASGYIINDIEDIEIDRINKPEHKRIVGRVYPLNMSWLFYWTLVVLGFGISLYLALFINDFVQLAIYPVAVALLWAYSRWFKQQFLVGNLVVSAFCGFVAWVVFYAQSFERSEYQGL